MKCKMLLLRRGTMLQYLQDLLTLVATECEPAPAKSSYKLGIRIGGGMATEPRTQRREP
jgi:hypothetical protein